jgi:SAM-dependent methyltransferase
LTRARSEPFEADDATARSPLRVVRDFYAALIDEVARAGYDAEDVSLLAHPHDYYGRYLDPRSRAYVVLAVMPRIAEAISYFGLPAQPRRRIFDLGCGLGMQSLIFASLGATVVGVDVREESVALCRKRKAFYEKALGRALDLEFHHGDFGLIDRIGFGDHFDALFSMSAFSYVKPLERTAGRISQILRSDAQLFLYEENAMFAFDRFKRSEAIPRPHAVVDALQREGFRAEFLRGAGAVPSGMWRVAGLNRLLWAPLNDAMRKSLRLSFSYVLGMRRGAGV